MSTDRQKSFIGTLSCEGRAVSITNLSLSERGPSSVLTAFSGAAPAKFYFRWERSHYVMYVRSQSHFGQLVNMNRHGMLAVSPSEQANKINIDLGGKSLDNFPKNFARTHIKINGELITIVGTSNGIAFSDYAPLPEIFFFQSERSQNFAYFDIKIIERNAPYLSHPDEV
jgi:hypothetical protein